MFIDEPALSNRMMQWMDFKYQVSAELYYETTYAMETQNAWTSQYEFGNNGDGSIWYPGKPSIIGGTSDIPVESFRMKMLRAGMQDYEYLNLLNKLGDSAFAQTELAKVVTSASNFVSNPAVLDQVRLDMATEIEAKSGAPTCGGSDGGVPLSDAGTVPSDAGTVPPDAGTTRPDSGSPPVDAGPKADAGATPTDSGTSPPDSGVIGNDAGASQSDGGVGQVVGGCHCGSSGELGTWSVLLLVGLGRIRRRAAVG
jgi:hypothetical protein